MKSLYDWREAFDARARRAVGDGSRVQKRFRLQALQGARSTMMSLPVVIAEDLQNLDPASADFGKTKWMLDYDPLG